MPADDRRHRDLLGLDTRLPASHSRLLACAAHEQSPNDFTLGAAVRIASASIGAGFV